MVVVLRLVLSGYIDFWGRCMRVPLFCTVLHFSGPRARPLRFVVFHIRIPPLGFGFASEYSAGAACSGGRFPHLCGRRDLVQDVVVRYLHTRGSVQVDDVSVYSGEVVETMGGV